MHLGEGVGGGGGRGGQPGRFVPVDTGAEAAAGFGGAMGVGDDAAFSAVGRVDDGRDLGAGHPGLVDQRDEVHGGVGRPGASSDPMTCGAPGTGSAWPNWRRMAAEISCSFTGFEM